jgi:hypothetical protein
MLEKSTNWNSYYFFGLLSDHLGLIK